MTNPPFLHDSYREEPDLRCCGTCQHCNKYGDFPECRKGIMFNGFFPTVSETAICDLYAPDPLLTAIEQGEDDVLHGREATWQDVFGGSDD